MAILNWLLTILVLLEEIADFTEFLMTSTGLALIACILSYQAFLIAGYNAAFSVIFASIVTLTLHRGLSRSLL